MSNTVGSNHWDKGAKAERSGASRELERKVVVVVQTEISVSVIGCAIAKALAAFREATNKRVHHLGYAS